MVTKIVFIIPNWIRWMIFMSYLSFLVYGSLTSKIRVPKLLLFANSDKLIHFLMYFIFATLALWSLDLRHASSKDIAIRNWQYGLVLVMAFMWGTMMEVFQKFLSSGRQFSYWDMMANLLGAIIGISLYYILFVLITSRTSK